jgi:hypothetical protein
MPTTTVARAMATAAFSEMKGGRKNGRFELPPSARGVLVLADPPESGWRMRPLERGGYGRVRAARHPDRESGCDQQPARCGSR